MGDRTMSTDRSRQLERIGRLAAVARALERDGVYNGAKLVRAALERELVRFAAREAPAAGPGLADEVAGLPADLVDGGYGAAFLDAFVAVAVAAREGAPLPLSAAPPVRTCRVCGELFLGADVPVDCPTCDAPAFSFREQLPVWYLEPAEPGTILAALASGPGRVGAALRGRDDAALARAPRALEWSARETLQHLVYTESLLAERARRLLREDDPDLVVWSVGSGEAPPSDEASAATGAPASELLARYRALRGATVSLLRDLDEAAWGRSGRHPEWGRVTVLSQAAYFARHEASHLAQLKAAADGRTPGEPGS